jgi:hypothetical protein
MSIIVVCEGCRKSFKVSDKFAGKSGPCPKCKRVIQVPAAGQEVTVHAPQQYASGGRSTTGKLVLEPVAFRSAKIEPVRAALLVAAVLIVLVGVWLGGERGTFQNPIAITIGLLLISPPLALGGYTFLRNDELEPFRGMELYVRSSICALAYVLLWGVFAFLAYYDVITGDLWIWLFVGVPLMAAGGGIALAVLDLDFTNGVLHYAFYLLVTVLLHRAAGLKWIWDIAT